MSQLHLRTNTLDATDTLVTGEKPAVRQFLYPLSMYQCKTLQLENGTHSLEMK